MTAQDIKNWVRTQLWDQVPMAISIIDRNFNIVGANRCFEETYGDWRSRPCYWVYKGRSERCEQCAATASFDDGRDHVREELGVVRDGKQTYYSVHMVPLVHKDGSIPFVFEMSTDITHTKVLEQEMLRAERLAVVGQTVAGLAHGIKNVLMGLDGGMYMAKSGIQSGNTERLLEGWQILEENVARISSFVKEFLEFAKGRVPDVQLMDPRRPALQVIDLFKDTARLAGIELSVRVPDEMREAPMDEEAIHTCLTNLVSNALDACETSDKPEHRVSLKVSAQDGVIVYEVSDNGSGMDYEVKKKVFTNFFSTKASGKGTGLGLLTTSKIVQEHGGRVSFESDKGRGSTFRLQFPRSRLPRPGEVDERRAI